MARLVDERLPVLALTGSNGKTTTKEMLYHILAGRMRVAGAVKSYNNAIGVPLTLLGAGLDADAVVRHRRRRRHRHAHDTRHLAAGRLRGRLAGPGAPRHPARRHAVHRDGAAHGRAADEADHTGR